MERSKGNPKKLADLADWAEDDSREWAKIQKWIEENGLTEDQVKVTYLAFKDPTFFEMWRIHQEVARRLAGRKRKGRGGPKGPRIESQQRRTMFKLLKKEGITGLEACKKLDKMKIPIPSKDRRFLYNNSWVKWFRHDSKSFYKQWSADLNRPSF